MFANAIVNKSVVQKTTGELTQISVFVIAINGAVLEITTKAILNGANVTKIESVVKYLVTTGVQTKHSANVIATNGAVLGMTGEQIKNATVTQINFVAITKHH